MMDLQALLLDLSGCADDESLEAFARRAYAELYLDGGHVGARTTHDGHKVLFFERQFEHAFFSDESHGRFAFARKDLLARDRIERMRWIGELVAGRVPDSVCWEVPSESGEYRPPTRLYIISPVRFVVYLRPRKNEFPGWSFSTAFVARGEDLTRRCRSGRKVWTYVEPKKGNAP